MKNFLAVLFIGLFCSHSVTALAADTATAGTDRTPLIRQQMILFGLYVNGLNTELTRTVPRSDEVNFLSDTLQESIRRIRETKGDAVFHKNLSELESAVVDLRHSSRENVATVKTKITAVIDQCAKCHMLAPSEVKTRVPSKSFLQTQTTR